MLGRVALGELVARLLGQPPDALHHRRHEELAQRRGATVHHYRGQAGFARPERLRRFGTLSWNKESPAVSPERTIYDVASLTKVVGTTTAIMVLIMTSLLAIFFFVAGLELKRELLRYAFGSQPWPEILW